MVDNIPFFVRDISLGDEISTKQVGDISQFKKLVKKSKNSTVRILLKNPKVENAIRKKLTGFGCGVEFMRELLLFAACLPPEVDIDAALSFLDKEDEKGNIGMEESAVRYQ